MPTSVIALGFAFGALPFGTWGQFTTLDPDTPASGFYRPLVSMAHTLSAARVALVLATVWLAAMFVLGNKLLRRSHLTTVISCLLLIALPALTTYTFVRFFRVNGLSGRPITGKDNGSYDWVDKAVGASASVTMIPYPVSSSWFVSQRVWRDYEWWNTSINHDAHFPAPGIFEYTGIWFPKLYLRFNPQTGAANVSPTPYVLTADQETRFHLAGVARVTMPDVTLSAVREPWRAAWLSFGLYDDGWTRPGVPVRVRVFPFQGQRTAVLRDVTFQVHPPDPVATRPFEVRSNLAMEPLVATNQHSTIVTVHVCVPARGFTEVRLTTPDSSWIPGDQRDEPSSGVERRGGLYLSEIALADEIGPAC
jgi:hypothetical protein